MTVQVDGNENPPLTTKTTNYNNIGFAIGFVCFQVKEKNKIIRCHITAESKSTWKPDNNEV